MVALSLVMIYLSITCCTFESNSVSMGEGGAIYNGPYPKAKAVATTKAKSMFRKLI